MKGCNHFSHNSYNDLIIIIILFWPDQLLSFWFSEMQEKEMQKKRSKEEQKIVRNYNIIALVIINPLSELD